MQIIKRLVDIFPLRHLGPGLVTGAADDDPSGIATYSQVGAQFGYSVLWLPVFSLPLMIGIQAVSARIGRVTGQGIAANLRRHFPPSLLYSIVGLLLFANTLNLGADIGAMAAAVQLMVGGPPHVYAILFGAVCLMLQVFLPFDRYAPLLKWLTLWLFSYVVTALVVHVPWREVARHAAVPTIVFDRSYMLGVVAVLGTTISPYLFFWQATHEAEDLRTRGNEKPLRRAPERAPLHLRRIKLDTYIGMAFSNLIAFFIILTAAVTLHANGVTRIEDSAQAAAALRPLAGDLAFHLFAAGIIGTGLLAVPILAGSAAYAVAEALRWPRGLALAPREAIGFYSVLAVATLIGVVLNFTPIDPIKALYWSAIVNGVIAVPVMAVMMVLAAKPRVMGRFMISLRLRLLGWLATLVMAAAAAVMLITLGR